MKPTLLLIAGLMFCAAQARAQVVINQEALDQLAGVAPRPVAAAPAPEISSPRSASHRIAYRHITAAHPRLRRRPASGLAAIPLPPRAAIPLPPAAAIPLPPRAAPGVQAQSSSARPVTGKPQAQPVVAKPATPALPAPRRPAPAIIDFAAGAADLPGGSAATLKPFCAHPAGMVVIDAYAAAAPADPSQAARLSMDRAFAIRDALTACGVPSSNIIPRANGAAKTANPDAAEVSASP